MNTRKITIAGTVVLVVTSLLVSPVQAHRKYRPHFKGLPHQILVKHSHSPQGSIKTLSETRSKTEDFDLFNEAIHLVTGTMKAFGKVASVILPGSAESVE
jgi:hypothetical protein